MSNISPEVAARNIETVVYPANFERTQRIGEALGACCIQLGENLTFSQIFAGQVPITETSVVLDRQGQQLNTYELLAQI